MMSNFGTYDQWVVFQSLSRIYIYDTKTEVFKLLLLKIILQSRSNQNAIYFQSIKEGLFEKVARIVSNNPVLQNNKINILVSKDFNSNPINGFTN
jgi:hypothetical protein